MNQLQEIFSKISWLVVISIVAAWGAYCVFFQDRSQLEQAKTRRKGAKVEIKNLQDKILEAEEFEGQLKKKREDIAELEAKLRTERAGLPKMLNIPELLNDLLFEAKQVGLEVKKITPASSDTKRELYFERSIDITTRSSFLQLFIFLDRLSRLKQLVGVVEVKVRASGSGEKITLKGTTGAMSGARLYGGEKSYIAIEGSVKLLAFRID